MAAVGGLETIGQPWLFEPDVDALVELMRRVVSDRDGAKRVGMSASAHIRKHFTWRRTVEVVERRLRVLVEADLTRPEVATSGGFAGRAHCPSKQAQPAGEPALHGNLRWLRNRNVTAGAHSQTGRGQGQPDDDREK